MPANMKIGRVCTCTVLVLVLLGCCRPISARYHPPAGQDNAYVAMCLVVKNQNADLPEWVQYHSYIGVRKFYIYDHGSTPPAFQSLQRYIQTGLVEYKYYVGHHSGAVIPRLFENTGQGYGFAECINSAKHRHRWLAFIDADEFLVIKDPEISKQNINNFLADFEAHPGLAVNWVTFGSAGHLTRPTGSTLTQYTKCFPGSHKNELHIKTIANTAFLTGINSNPHYFSFAHGKLPVTENLEPVPAAHSARHSSNRIALHHYTVKSLEDYKKKVKRGGGSGAVKNMHYIVSVDALAKEECMAAVEKGRQCCE
jgi:hypothetical protein